MLAKRIIPGTAMSPRTIQHTRAVRTDSVFRVIFRISFSRSIPAPFSGYRRYSTKMSRTQVDSAPQVQSGWVGHQGAAGFDLRSMTPRSLEDGCCGQFGGIVC